MAETLAVFDLEGTLCQGGALLWRETVKWQFRHGHNVVKIIVHALSVTFIGLLFKAGLIPIDRMRLSALRSMAGLLQGISEHELNQLSSLVAERMLTRLRPEMQKILQGHKAQGHRIVLMSGIFEPFLEEIGRRLGVESSIGTKLEKRGARYTGRLSGEVCFGEHRATLLKEYIQASFPGVDLAQSYAYGDTIGDRPVMELAGHPVAVYPDAKLEAHARKHGWEIIG